MANNRVGPQGFRVKNGASPTFQTELSLNKSFLLPYNVDFRREQMAQAVVSRITKHVYSNNLALGITATFPPRHRVGVLPSLYLFSASAHPSQHLHFSMQHLHLSTPSARRNSPNEYRHTWTTHGVVHQAARKSSQPEPRPDHVSTLASGPFRSCPAIVVL